MADFYTIKPEIAVSAPGTQLREKQHDNGDGTSSPVVYIDSIVISGPITLSAAQIATLTPPPAITNYANETGGNLAAIKANTDKPQFDANGRLITTSGTAAAGEDLTLADTQGVTQKPVVSPKYSATPGVSFGTSTAISAKSSTGNLKSVSSSNTNATVRYLQVHDKATTPIAGNVPILSFPISGNGGITQIGTEFLGEGGLYLPTGIALAVSSAVGTYVAPTAADHVINWTYV